jgi:hypothetical protein
MKPLTLDNAQFRLSGFLYNRVRLIGLIARNQYGAVCRYLVSRSNFRCHRL